MSDSPAALKNAHLSHPAHQLQCMEIIGGNQATKTSIASPGLDIWVDSEPVEGAVGGDVHYFSMCGSGRVTRLAVADVSGHGPTIDDKAKSLRRLMRKYINLLDQTRFARAINHEFTQQADSNYFATVLLVTYFAPTDHLIICNAGHPPPIWFSTRAQRWQVLRRDTPDTGESIREAKGTYLLKPVANLPLGVIEPTDYFQFTAKLRRGDIVLVYTDGLIEAQNPAGEQLGEAGLLRLAEQLNLSAPHEIGAALLDQVNQWRGHAQADDDQTLIVMRHNASDPPRLTVGQALKSMAKMIGLKRSR